MQAEITPIVRRTVNGYQYIAPLVSLEADSVDLHAHCDIVTINSTDNATIVLSHDQARQLRELLNHADVAQLLD